MFDIEPIDPIGEFMPDAAPDLVDVHVGRALRARRQELGQSQSDLAEALGVSFQQVQKYERGTNRISASMMFRAAQAQQVAPAYYFEGLNHPEQAASSAEAAEIRTWLAGPQAWGLAQAMLRLPPAARAALLRFARMLGVNKRPAPSRDGLSPR